ncbi:unnamed protein product [Parnassius apollo]|uniref:(apollo) hypothetical protein n=1 Tax=Parnassius apollo TaxID=110799 RepID=A0A8S3WQ80_PARAO|nr:unnamed protein product [Parnassius apollo]
MAAINCRFAGERRSAVCVTDHGGAGRRGPRALNAAGRVSDRPPAARRAGLVADWPVRSRAPAPARLHQWGRGLAAESGAPLGRAHSFRCAGRGTSARRRRCTRASWRRTAGPARPSRPPASPRSSWPRPRRCCRAHALLQRCASRHRLRDPRGERRRGAARALPLVASRRPPQRGRAGALRSCTPCACRRRLPRWPAPGALLHPRATPFPALQPCKAAGALARSALPGGRASPWTPARPRRQVQGAEEVSTAADDLGRRAEDALLQGADALVAQRMVPSRSLPEPDEEEGAGGGDGTDADAGRQLVQESTPEGQSGGREEQISAARPRVRLVVHLRRGLGRLGDQRRRGVATA